MGDQQLSDLDGVRRGTLPQVVADAPERQAVLARDIFADSADERSVVVVARARHRVKLIVDVVDDLEAGRRGEKLACFFDRDLLLGFDQNAFAVAVRDGHANAGWANEDRIVAENLLGLVDHFHLFGRVTLVLGRADLRDAVEGDRVGERFVIVLFASQVGFRAVDQIARASDACSACRLIRADDDALDFASVVQRLQRLDHLRRRAVRTGNDALMLLDGVGIHFGDNKRNFLVHAPEAALVDDDAASLDGFRDELAGRIVWRAGDDQVDAVERLGHRFFDRVRFTAERQFRTRRAVGEEFDRFEREGPFFEKLSDERSYGTGCADDGDGIVHDSSPWRLNPPVAKGIRRSRPSETPDNPFNADADIHG